MISNFYTELVPFKKFEDFTHAAHYQPVPDDWFVYVTDVVNSTQAVADGHYKEVNLIGAASITLCINLFADMEFPFVFGGDGASMCMPAHCCEKVDAELGSLIRLATDNYQLQLRVAKIPVSALVQQNSQVLVAKFELTYGNTLAFFRGGGLELADQLAKTRYAEYRVQPASRAVESLAGLSCRWSPIPASKECIVSMLVKARNADAQFVYKEMIEEFRSVMGQSLDDANPVVLEKVRYKSFFSAVAEELHYHRSVLTGSFLKRVFEIFLSIIIFRHGINVAANSFDNKHYIDSVRLHSDYRKFDDTLRLVLDCTEAQAAALEASLLKAREQGAIYYGLFRSKEALMTCFVETMQDGGHLHFIDGGDGGLAMAAQQLKKQMAAA